MRAWGVLAWVWWWAWPAPADAAVPPLRADTLAAVAAAVQGRFFSSCVLRVQHWPPGFAESLSSVELEKHLAVQRRTLTFAAHNSTSSVRPCPRNKVLAIADLSYVTTPGFLRKDLRRDLTWLVAVNGSEWRARLGSCYVPLDTLLLVAEVSPGGQLVEITEVFNPGRRQPLEFALFGRWTPTAGLYTAHNDVTALYLRRRSLRGATLTVITYHDPPSVTLSKKGPIFHVRGYFGEVWKTLETHLAFRTRWIVQKRPNPGYHKEDGTWDGAAEALLEGKADVALIPTTMRPYQGTPIAFSYPLYYSRDRLFVKRMGSPRSSWGDYVAPFESRLWAAVALSVPTLAAALSTLYRLGRQFGTAEASGPYYYSFYDSLLYVFGAFCQQGHDITPQSNACRIVYITAYITAIITFAAYSAALISSLTVVSDDLPFSDIEGLLRDGTYTVGVLNRTETYQGLTKAEPGSLNRLLFERQMAPFEDSFPRTIDVALRRVCGRQRYAFYGLEDAVKALQRHANCSVAALPYSTYPHSVAFAFSQRSPYQGIINYNLGLLRDAGVLQRLRMYEWPKEDTSTVKSSLTSVSLRSVTPVLLLLASSAVVAVGTLLVERCVAARQLPRCPI
uniref:Glutamate receptor, ionotropic n=1 Tax=Schistocerca gregaria TaxID=7010 RepID=A0A8E5JT58_SCHGR|nr:Glutamate receptor, ionotropic [Schistocerca gregaria]